MARSDFNKDGFSDITWWNGKTQQASSWNMANGGINIVGNFNWPSNKGAPWAQGDYSGDGYADLLTSTRSSSNNFEWGLWKTNPGSTPTWQSLGTFSKDWLVLRNDQSDLTGDGTDDILWFNTNTHEIGFQEMRNGEVVSYQKLTGLDWLTNIGFEPAGLPKFFHWGEGLGGDFNGDGRDDILLTNYLSGETAIAFTFPNPSGGMRSIATGLGEVGRIEETGDFTGDGSTDIIFNQNGNLYLYDMLNGAVSNTRYLGNFPGWDIVGGAAGDFTRDGVEDVMWRHTSTGEFGYWDFNAGDSQTQTWVSLGTAPQDWLIV
jgi:hypothetical protein